MITSLLSAVSPMLGGAGLTPEGPSSATATATSGGTSSSGAMTQISGSTFVWLVVLGAIVVFALGSRRHVK